MDRVQNDTPAAGRDEHFPSVVGAQQTVGAKRKGTFGSESRKTAASGAVRHGGETGTALPCMEDVLRAVSRLAFGSARDCAKLAAQKQPRINALDLDLLSEIRRSEKGTVDVKTVDRISALRLLAELLGAKDTDPQAAIASITAEL